MKTGPVTSKLTLTGYMMPDYPVTVYTIFTSYEGRHENHQRNAAADCRGTRDQRNLFDGLGDGEPGLSLERLRCPSRRDRHGARRRLRGSAVATRPRQPTRRDFYRAKATSFLLEKTAYSPFKIAARVRIAKNSFFVHEPFCRDSADAEAKADFIVPMLAIVVLRPGHFVFF